MVRAPLTSDVGLLVLGWVIARDRDQALSRLWVSNFIIHTQYFPDLNLQSFLEHVEQFSNYGSGALITYRVYTTSHRGMAS